MKQGKIVFRFWIISFALIFHFQANAQLIVDTSLTPAQLVQNVLLGPGIIASNITYTGYSRAIGKFTALNTNLGIDSGIVMTSGSVLRNDSTFNNRGPGGPNDIGSDGAWNQTVGTDTDLNAIVGNSTYDAAVLAFDFVAQSDSVKFRYIFGSEEYSDYVNSTYNDVFAFLLNGVSVVLTQTNIALIPSTATPVSINNVNNGQTWFGPAPGPCTNCAYYVDNPAYDAVNNPVVAPYDSIQYDGFTTVLTAMYPVQCGETYHIKLAIADVFDHVFDSGVFLEAGSFQSGTVDLSSHVSYGSSNDSTLYEGCGQACIYFTRQGNISMQDTATITLGGTASASDYTPTIPSQLIFLPGQDSISICISATQDGNPESVETLTLQSVSSGPCVASVATDLTLYISDANNISVNAGNDTSICNASPITLYTNVTGGIQPYIYNWSTGATTPNITVNPAVTTSYTITVSDQCGTPVGIDTVTVFLPAGAFTITTSPDLVLCSGSSALLTVSPSGGSMPYFISWTTVSGNDSVPVTGGYVEQFTPTGSGIFVVMVREGCGQTASDSIAVTVNDCGVIAPNVFTPNNDGTNDQLIFTGLEHFPNSSLHIYNRWGNKVYESANYQNDWTGSGISDGTYYYVLHLSSGSDLTGFVTALTHK
ncbi:MAG: gliding motility-associated C-terminal domain-containing protein [Bacteroidetes bacterium]|nr:gliding motility-associated C-terminal domain-containing protein [Bacteroidota bacterium]